jgi:heavy metal translocating P-type ATPase
LALEKFALNRALVVFSLLTLFSGGAAYVQDYPEIASYFWMTGTSLVFFRLSYLILTHLHKGAVGLDIIAALAMAGSLILGEPLAGNVIALMFAGGQVLEDYAQSRARREMTALLARSPRFARRYSANGLVEIAIEDIAPGDRLLIRPGEVLPVDGHANVGITLDESVMSGEAVPVSHEPGRIVVSGVVNVGGAFDLIAETDAAGSTYAAIIRLVESAQASQAPMARLADRYAVAFLVFTVTLAGVAWIISGDPERALAVLVVATPCPLILAVPVAIVAGISRCAKIGVLVKHGGALEGLAQTKTLLFDKTGTLTAGRPTLRELIHDDSWSDKELLFYAGSLAQASHHVVAKSLADAATNKKIALEVPLSVEEVPGDGVIGRVNDRDVVLGSVSFVKGKSKNSDWSQEALSKIEDQPGLITAVAVNGTLVGLIMLSDEVRPEANRTLHLLRKIGIRRMVLLTGDRQKVANAVAQVQAVQDEERLAVSAMVGDGVNDAPALAAARVGIAMGARGAGASSEAADVVLLVDTLARLPEAFFIARRSFNIAWQSVFFGIGLSGVAMMVAAFGFLTPLSGAVVQELIDIAVILNALRALAGELPARLRS